MRTSALTGTIPIIAAHYSLTRCFGPSKRRMPRIAPPILRADVHDERVGLLTLGLQSSDQRVFAIHHDVMHLALQLQPDGESHAHGALAPTPRLDAEWPPLLRLRTGRPPHGNRVARGEGHLDRLIELLLALLAITFLTARVHWAPPSAVRQSIDPRADQSWRP